MEGPLVLEAATLALFVIELVKFVIRRFILKAPDFEFPPVFYGLVIPFLTAASGWLLGYIGWGPAVVLEPRVILQWAVTIVVELALYSMGVERFKEFVRGRDVY